MSSKDFFAKYDVQAPRYTSYPTVPYWSVTPTLTEWTEHLTKTLHKSDSTISVYVHIPYCETLCTFCGCNTVITKDHKKEQPYVELIKKEIENYIKQVPILKNKTVKQIHLGGGTPTFLSPAHLKDLIESLYQVFKPDPHHFEGAIEVDPRRTTEEQLKTLRALGFNRISLGVQDFDSEVQRLVNRIQPFEVTKKITDQARALGYKSINYDLIYGLAKQTLLSIEKTIQQTIELAPDRIALYSFAQVPWIKPQQRLFKDEDLPQGAYKRALYEKARTLLLQAGYVEVGMDHFAKPTEELAIKMKAHQLHRNFMGYTDTRTDVLLGLGVSSISETPYSFHQNEKVLPVYEERVLKGEIPTQRGHVLNEVDKKRRAQILTLMTEMRVELESEEQKRDASQFLAEMIQDGLVVLQEKNLEVTEKGKAFLRNVCMFFDEKLRSKQPSTQTFSKSI